jgi:hypothetical protein
MKTSHSPLRTAPPNLDRLNKLEAWTEAPLREALGQGEGAPEAVVEPQTPERAPEPASAPEIEPDDDLSWIAPKKPVAKMTYSLNLPADLHAKLKRLSEKTGESMNAMIVRGAEREYARILAAIGKKQ